MKKKWIAFLLVSVAYFGYGALLPPEAALTIKVIDDFDKPVAGIPVRISTYQRTTRGEGFGSDIYKDVVIRTDTNGFARWTGRSRMPYVPFGIPPIDGYHFGSADEYRFKEVKGGKWQPWNPTVQLIVKPILNPVPVYLSQIQTQIKTPHEKHGFDLLVEDWVAPEGHGKIADVIFEVTGYRKTNREYDTTLIVSFPNPGDGIQEFALPKPGTGSDLASPRYAPSDSYKSELRLRKARLDQGITVIDDIIKDRGYFLRIRSVVDQTGQVKSAMYGKIHQGFWFGGPVENCGLQIKSLYLNPELNSRNMEFDLKRNLVKPGKR